MSIKCAPAHLKTCFMPILGMTIGVHESSTVALLTVLPSSACPCSPPVFTHSSALNAPLVGAQLSRQEIPIDDAFAP